MREESLDDLDELYELYDTLADCEFIEPLYELEKEKEFVRNYINNMYRFLSTECGWYILKIQAGLLDVWELKIEALTGKMFRK